MSTLITGRFAPSPTGPLHLGSLVAALGSYLFARRAGGHWLLRIDDLDQPRVIPGMADDILRTLEQLGFEWDSEPVWQSSRSAAYEEALLQLHKSGEIYPCGCSRREITRIASAPHGDAEELLYPGTCRMGIPSGKEQRAIRIRVSGEPICLVDGVFGEFCQNLTKVCGDFIIKRADGLFAYHLATVVDDVAAGVNQVVRGADLIFSTPRQIYLQQLLGHEQPAYFHLPLVTAPGGAKLSKRESAVSIAAGRDLAIDGGALLIQALRFLGQPVAELSASISVKDILKQALLNFMPERISTIGGAFPMESMQ